MNSLKRIVLHGALADQFGAEHHLDVFSAAEAIRALIFTRKGFKAAFSQGEYRVIRGDTLSGITLNENTLHMGLGNADLHIIPSLEGSGGGGSTGKIIIGVALVALAVVTAGAGAAAGGAAAAGAEGAGAAAGAAASSGFLGLGASTGILGITFGQVAGVGAALILSGISQMISPSPKQNSGSTSTTSYLFNGATNTASEGSCVPVVYGKMLVGSVVMGYSVLNVDVGASQPSGGKSGQGNYVST